MRWENGDAMRVSDPETWKTWVDSNTDPYGGACVSYAERWAELMELAMDGDETLAECADRCSNEANAEGITGFMYGAAVQMLATSWVHGEELRRWHNLKTQLGDEGERANKSGAVLNPAVISFGDE